MNKLYGFLWATLSIGLYLAALLLWYLIPSYRDNSYWLSIIVELLSLLALKQLLYIEKAWAVVVFFFVILIFAAMASVMHIVFSMLGYQLDFPGLRNLDFIFLINSLVGFYLSLLVWIISYLIQLISSYRKQKQTIHLMR